MWLSLALGMEPVLQRVEWLELGKAWQSLSLAGRDDVSIFLVIFLRVRRNVMTETPHSWFISI
jgi:hypothetical protein